MKLNLQSIRMAEQLLGKPFGDFDLTSKEDADVLIYCTLVTSSDETFTRNTYRHLSKKVKRDAIKQITSELSFLQQFDKEEDTPKRLKGKRPDSMYMGEIAATLILAGVDARFVLYEMRLFEIKDYLAALDTKLKNKLENGRLWTYYSILPHVDAKKLKSPKDLFLFPWEVEEEEKAKAAEFEKGAKMFRKFMESKPVRYGNR